MTFHNVSYQWLPVIDKHRYRPLPVSVDFLQNVFDLVFLLIFIWYWNWGPLLVVLYYAVEAVVLSFFTSLKWWKSNVFLIPKSKANVIVIFSIVVSILSYGQITAVHNVLGMNISFPSWEEMMSDEKQFVIGFFAIVLQHMMEYKKYNHASKNTGVDIVTAIITPVLRIFVQQFFTLLVILLLLALSFIDLKAAAIMIALMVGSVKVIFGQLHLVLKK